MKINRWLVESPWVESGGQMELWENRRLQLANHQGLEEYAEGLIKIKTEAGLLEIRGDQLKILSLGSELLTIEGQFRQLNWLEDKSDKRKKDEIR